MLRSLALLFASIFIATPPYAHAQISATPAPARGENGMVVAAEHNAVEAGVEMLRKGGNAVDAAVATAFALAVTYPAAGNIGGGGFAIIREPDGTTSALDFREKAPAAAHRDMYLDDDGEVITEASRRGYLASGVPGAVAGLLEMHETHGALERTAVLDPAIRLARDGFRLSLRQAESFNHHRNEFLAFEGSAKAFTKPDSTDWEEGEIFRQPDLAATLTRIRDHGRDGFYAGETADLIVAEMQHGGGLITREDLNQYEAVWREPIRTTYRGHRVFSMPPPSSGGIALAQLLHALEPFDVEEMGFNSSATIHLMGEAMRRVYADRAEWLGDSDFVDVPIIGLIDSNYMADRMSDFDPDQADSSLRISHGSPVPHESTETTHLSVVDNEGRAVSLTTTINGGYGSFVTVDGGGFLLNNEMDDFSAKPGVPNMYGLVGAEANAIEPGKRMLSSMTPTIVEDPEENLFLVIGSPGGAKIITTVLQVIVNVIDHGLDIQAAVAAPRIHHQWLPDTLYTEPRALSTDVVENLTSRGWAIEEQNRWSRADGITVACPEPVGDTQPVPDPRPSDCVLFGGADPRGEDVAIGL